MGRKCNVLYCLSDSRRIEDQGVTFHKMPTHSDLRPKWLELCKIPEQRRNVKVIYVCSRHFLRADFCNFKGTKYMLKQGALPSVFPWTNDEQKNQLNNETENLINDIKEEDIQNKNDVKCEIKSEPEYENEDENSSGDDKIIDGINIVTGEMTSNDSQFNEGNFEMKEIFVNKESVKAEKSTSLNTHNVGTSGDLSSSINFTPGTRIEANDFHDKWYSARIIEVDYDDKEVFIHYEKCPNRANEWIPMDSSRLRPLQLHKKNVEVYTVGEKCLATWSDTRKFPATIKRVLDTGNVNIYYSFILCNRCSHSGCICNLYLLTSLVDHVLLHVISNATEEAFTICS